MEDRIRRRRSRSSATAEAEIGQGEDRVFENLQAKTRSPPRVPALAGSARGGSIDARSAKRAAPSAKRDLSHGLNETVYLPGDLCRPCARHRNRTQYEPRAKARRAEEQALGPELRRKVRSAVRVAERAMNAATGRQNREQ